jgi:putative peptidoglycan lipid II flippase
MMHRDNVALSAPGKGDALNWWSTWQHRSINRRIFAAIITVGGLTVLVKLAAAGKELVIAYRFGTTDALDAFIMAFLLPQFAIELIGGSLNGAFIPTYIHVLQHEGQAAAQRLFSTVMASSLVLVIVAAVMLTALVTYLLPVLASGFGPEKLALTRRLYFFLLPTLLCCGFAAIWSAILNAAERFALAAVIPIITPLLTMLLLLGLGTQGGIVILAIGTVLGLALEAGLLGWRLRRNGVSILPWWYGATPAVKQVFRQYSPAVMASFLMGSTAIISQSMAATLGPGSVSALAYGSKATTLVLGIGSVAISTAVLPHFSRMVALGDAAGLRHTLKTYARLILLVTLPLAAVLIYYSEPLVRLVLQRGAFTQADTDVVSRVQVLYLLQIPLIAVSILFVRVISSLKASHLLLWGTVGNLILIVLFTYLFLQRFQVVGVALAISLMHLISAAYLMYAGLRLTNMQPRSTM